MKAFSLAYLIQPANTFKWTYTTASDALESGSTVYLRWNNTFPNVEGQIFVRYGLEDWIPVNLAKLNDQQFKINIKDTSGLAQLKMAISGKEFLSDTFAVSKLAEIRVENNCKEKLTLSWNEVENANQYKILKLQENVMVPFASTEDTIMMVSVAQEENSYYAVQPFFDNNILALRSYTLNTENASKGCYLDGFLAFIDINKQANIQLSLNAPWDIEEVKIMKQYHEKIAPLQLFKPDARSYEFKDDELKPGYTSYWTELSLSGGGSVFSDTLGLFYTDQNTVIVFPNPVQEDFISVLNEFPGGTLQLYSEKGALIKEYELEYVVEDLDLTGLTAGVYLFRIAHEGRFVNSGKIIRN